MSKKVNEMTTKKAINIMDEMAEKYNRKPKKETEVKSRVELAEKTYSNGTHDIVIDGFVFERNEEGDAWVPDRVMFLCLEEDAVKEQMNGFPNCPTLQAWSLFTPWIISTATSEEMELLSSRFVLISEDIEAKFFDENGNLKQ